MEMKQWDMHSQENGNYVDFLHTVRFSYFESWWKKPSNFQENSWKFMKFHECSWIFTMLNWHKHRVGQFMKFHELFLVKYDEPWGTFHEFWWTLMNIESFSWNCQPSFWWILVNFHEQEFIIQSGQSSNAVTIWCHSSV